MGRCHRGSSPPQIVSRRTDFYSGAGDTQKNCAIGGGSQAVSALTHMNRHKQQKRRKNQNRNQTLERKTYANHTASNQLNQSFSSRCSLWLNTRFPANDCFSCSARVRSVRCHSSGYPDRGKRLQGLFGKP